MNKNYDDFLPKDVAARFKTKNWTGGSKQYFGSKFGTVNLEKLTLSQAQRLVDSGFKKLEKKTANKK